MRQTPHLDRIIRSFTWAAVVGVVTIVFGLALGRITRDFSIAAFLAAGGALVAAVAWPAAARGRRLALTIQQTSTDAEIGIERMLAIMCVRSWSVPLIGAAAVLAAFLVALVVSRP